MVVPPIAAPDAVRRVVTALGYIPPIPTEDLNSAHPHGRGSHMYVVGIAARGLAKRSPAGAVDAGRLERFGVFVGH